MRPTAPVSININANVGIPAKLRWMTSDLVVPSARATLATSSWLAAQSNARMSVVLVSSCSSSALGFAP